MLLVPPVQAAERLDQMADAQALGVVVGLARK